MSQTAPDWIAPPGCLGMPSDCSIRSIGAVAEKLRDLLAAGRSADLACGSVETADITFVQLVASARRSFAERGLSLTVEEPSAAALSAFARAGVSLA